MAFNPLNLLHERQCAPIYNALDSNNASLALKQSDALLASQPDLHLAAALRCIALIRLGRREEAGKSADALMKSQAALKSTVVLNPLCLVLSSLDRTQEEVELLDSASKASPNSVEIGSKAFLAMIKAYQWQRAQQTSLRLHKLVSAKEKKNEDYFWSSMQAYSLIGSDDTLPGHQLALPLAQRMIAKHLEANAFGPNSDENMFLYATILRKQGKGQVKEALRLLSSEGRGQELCKRSMTLAALRYELLEEEQEWTTIYQEALSALESGDRNWSRVQEVVKGAVNRAKQDPNFSLNEVERRLHKLAQEEGKMDRTLKLAPLFLIQEAGKVGSPSAQLQSSNLLELFTAYFGEFCSKACAYEDLAPYAILLSKQEVETALQFLQEKSKPPAKQAFEDLDALYSNLNAVKLARLMQPAQDITDVTEMDAAQAYFHCYLCALPIGKDLPKTEMQPADDYALLTAQALTHASVLQRETSKKEATPTLHLAIVILTCALKYSPKGYRLRVLLIRLLRQFGAIDLARKEYELIGVKAIQHDTLGWILSSRAASSSSLLKAASDEEVLLASAVRRLQGVWREGKTQVPQMVSKAFGSGIHSRVEEIVDFGERLKHSLSRWLTVVETARTVALQTAADKARDGEKKLQADLQECCASLAKGKVSDQQDYHVLLDLMPALCGTIASLTSLQGLSEPRLVYLKAMLPVAMAHLGLTVPQDDVIVDGAEDAELTQEEKALCQLALAVMKKDEALVKSAGAGLFESARKYVDAQGSNDLPGRVLHSASVTLEGAALLKKASLFNQDHRQLLTSIHDGLEKAQWEKGGSPSLEWCKLLNKLPSNLREGQDGQALLRLKGQELQAAIDGGKTALLERMQEVLAR